jgi:hypothetical protein
MADPPVGWKRSDRCPDPDKHGHDVSPYAPGSPTRTGGIRHDERLASRRKRVKTWRGGRST